MNDYRSMLIKPTYNNINIQWMLKLRQQENKAKKRLFPSYLHDDRVPS